MTLSLPPEPTGTAETKEGTHRALLEAARRVLNQLGYQGATLDRIAAEAGYTKGAVYWHFKNKESLFLDLLAEALRDNLRELHALLDLAGDDAERIELEMAGYIERQFGKAVPVLALELELESRRNPSLAAVYRTVITRHQAEICRILERYYQVVGREPPMPVAQLTALVLAFAEGFALQRQSRPEQELDLVRAVKILLGMPKGV